MNQSRRASLEIGEHLPSPPSLVGASAAGIWVVPTIFYDRSNAVNASGRFSAKNSGARAFPAKISLDKLLAYNRAPPRHCSRTMN